MTETEFSRALGREGFTEILTRDMPAGAVLPEHSHPWDARLYVLSGEMRLKCGGHSQTLRAGEHCEVARGVPHAESYGPEGTWLLIGRRHPVGG